MRGGRDALSSLGAQILFFAWEVYHVCRYYHRDESELTLFKKIAAQYFFSQVLKRFS